MRAGPARAGGHAGRARAPPRRRRRGAPPRHAAPPGPPRGRAARGPARERAARAPARVPLGPRPPHARRARRRRRCSPCRPASSSAARAALEAPVLGLAGVIQTVPALALLAVMVPLLSGLGLPGIGTLPAFLALVLYSLLPILRNTVTGLHGVDPAVIEAARGVGMTPRPAAASRSSCRWRCRSSSPASAPRPSGPSAWPRSRRRWARPASATTSSAACRPATPPRSSPAASPRPRSRSCSTASSARSASASPPAAGALLAAAALGLLALAAWAWAPAGRGRRLPRRPRRRRRRQDLHRAVRPRRGPGRAPCARAPAARPATLAVARLDGRLRRPAPRRDRPLRRLHRHALGDRHGPQGARRVPPRGRWTRCAAGWPTRHGVTLVASLGFENAYCFAVRRETADRARPADASPTSPATPRGLSLASDYEFFARGGVARRPGRVRPRVPRAAHHGPLAPLRRRSRPGRSTRSRPTPRTAASTPSASSCSRTSAHAIPPYDAVVLASPRLAREAPDVAGAPSGPSRARSTSGPCAR